jgi:hypothetical protein
MARRRIGKRINPDVSPGTIREVPILAFNDCEITDVLVRRENMATMVTSAHKNLYRRRYSDANSIGCLFRASGSWD